MADYFHKFSVAIQMANEEQQNYALDLAQKAGLAYSGDELPAEFPKALMDVIEDWQFKTEAEGKDAIWSNSIYGGVYAASVFIQHLLQKFDPKGRVSLEWSRDCTKPRLDAYGGGAAFITAQEVKFMSTADWLAEQIAGVGPANRIQG